MTVRWLPQTRKLLRIHTLEQLNNCEWVCGRIHRTNFNTQAAKKHFYTLIERVLNGENNEIVQEGKPVARLLPILEGDLAPRNPGIDKEKVIIKPDFDQPLDEFEQ